MGLIPVIDYCLPPQICCPDRNYLRITHHPRLTISHKVCKDTAFILNIQILKYSFSIRYPAGSILFHRKG